MRNFDYSIPTRIHFGKGQISKLGAEVKSCGNHALLVYGGGSIKKTGLYEVIRAQLQEQGIEVTELSGVEPNPRIESVREGVALCREHSVDVVLAVGGGSVLDCAKVIAGAVSYEGDAWDVVKDKTKITSVLPIVTVLTLSATGSEMDPFAVISNLSTNEKLGIGVEAFKPQASILDPEYTFSVSAYQTAAGTADIMSHILESYFTNEKGAFVQARLCEALLKTCIQYGPAAVAEPENYEARANLMWTSSLAINRLLVYGADVEWSVHPMEHELSAFYDITHGVGLAILTPNWMEYVRTEENLWKFVEYGVNVWGLDPDMDDHEIADAAIQLTRDFFSGLGIPATLQEVGIDESKLEIMAEKAAAQGLQEAFIPLEAEDVLEIYKLSL